MHIGSSARGIAREKQRALIKKASSLSTADEAV
jgi:hypothetical protein